MFMNPDLGTQLARQQQRQMLAAAERRQHGGMTPSTPGTTVGSVPIRRLRRLAAVEKIPAAKSIADVRPVASVVSRLH